MNQWKKMYCVVNQGVLRVGKEYLVSEGGYDCYRVKNRGKIIYAPFDYFTFDKPRVRKYEEDEEEDSY